MLCWVERGGDVVLVGVWGGGSDWWCMYLRYSLGGSGGC